MINYLVTGGAGFIGSHLVKKLLKKGRVRVIDNFSTGKKENIKGLDIELIEADIRNPEKVKNACRGIDCIFHLAAIPSVTRSLKNPLPTNEVNVEGTLNLLIAAKENNVKRFVYSSSSSVYGENQKLPKKESMSPDPISPYAVSKLAGEYYCRLFSKLYYLEVIILRYFNVFGERQDPKGEYAAAIPKFIISALNKKRSTVYGDGEQRRDFTYVENTVEATIFASEAPEKAIGKTFNVASGKVRTVNEVLLYLNKILYQKIEPIYTKPRVGDIKDSWADISQANNLLGYSPRIDFENGLRKTVDWFKEKEQ